MENNQCFRCANFQRYYIRKVKHFEKTKLGKCLKEDETVNCMNGCDKFVFRKPKKVDKGLLKIYLGNLLTEISELRKTVEAEISENEELQKL